MTDYTDLVKRLRDQSWVMIAEEAADAIKALEVENERLKAAFRVNMLRCFSNMSHEEIDAEIDAAILGEKE
jgi:hypothetical protein